MSPNAFLSSIARKFESMVRYEDPELHKMVLNTVPVALLQHRAQNKMRALQAQVKQGNEDLDISIQELVLLEALAWFKEWMEWVDAPDCDACDGDTEFSHASRDFALLQRTGADRVEMFRCIEPSCGQMTPLERHSDPGRAWTGRRGRCGEWASAFTLLCRALRWEARLVCDSTDHAWSEVFSVAQRRWLHADPCEAIADQPLVYEAGWGKRLAYVIAYAHDDIQDVTWRYSAAHAAVRDNRTACSEHDLRDVIVNLRELKQTRFSLARRNYLAKRTALELVEMMTEKTTTEADKQGRSSGALSWRLQRGETKVAGGKVWVATAEDLAVGHLCVRFSAARDRYERVRGAAVVETLVGWDSGVFNAHGMFRKEEKDWKMVYLCREESAAEGKIEWRFSAPGRAVHKVSVRCDSETFENGLVRFFLSGNDKTLEFSSAVDSSDLRGADAVTLEARVSGGRGPNGWQHAQLFRQPVTNTTDFPFSVTVTFQ